MDPVSTSASLDVIAEAYVKLVLSLGPHDADYVDAYYGPPEWREEAERETPSLAQIRERATRLAGEIRELPDVGAGELELLRRQYLSTQLRALLARVELLDGGTLRFDEESEALYDAVAPTNDTEYFEAILEQLDPLLPGEGDLIDRYAEFKSAYVIPLDRLDAVFTAAIAACRERTSKHIELPAGESLEVEYVNGKSWSAYNWYRGDFHSLIQVNTDLPIYIDRAIDLACHEGYPGHHVYNALLEKHLVKDRGWVEFSVYALFSPQSLIAEGTAEYGIHVAFPGDDRVAFERELLFPLAGLDPETAERYYEVQAKVDRLGFAGNEAARRYLNGEIDGEAAAAWLTRYALMAPARAKQRVGFIDQYRSYVINYNLGQDLVRAYVERRTDGGSDPEKVWSEFATLLSSPRVPSGL